MVETQDFIHRLKRQNTDITNVELPCDDRTKGVINLSVIGETVGSRSLPLNLAVKKLNAD